MLNVSNKTTSVKKGRLLGFLKITKAYAALRLILREGDLYLAPNTVQSSSDQVLIMTTMHVNFFVIY